MKWRNLTEPDMPPIILWRTRFAC